MTIDPTATTPTTATFADAVRALTAVGPLVPGGGATKKKKGPAAELTKQKSTHGAGKEAWAWVSLEDWPSNPPVESLHLVSARPPGLGDAKHGPSAKKFMDWGNFGNAIGTWNARDRQGQWAGVGGQWLVVRAELSRGDDEDGEDGEGVAVVIACWKVAEGYAVMITRPYQASERVAAVMGMAWPASWQTESVWYGE